MAKKLDMTKEYETYYTAKIVPEIVEFGEIPFLTIEGKGKPAEEVFIKAIEAFSSCRSLFN